jgi:hypothetical protein
VNAASSRTILVTVVVVALLALSGFYLISMTPAMTAGSDSSTSQGLQGGNQTVLATYVSTMTWYSSSTTGSSTSATSTSSQSPTSGGSFTYTANSQVKVISVSALVSQGQSGSQTVSFSVEFENIGGSTIYVLEGGGSSMSASLTPGTAEVSKASSVACEMMVAEVSVAPMQDHTSVTPGCWSGYVWQLVSPGTVQVQITLGWSGSASAGSNSGSVDITAQFTLS